MKRISDVRLYMNGARLQKYVFKFSDFPLSQGKNRNIQLPISVSSVLFGSAMYNNNKVLYRVLESLEG